MVEDELRALKALELDWAPTPDDVWKHSPFHVDGLHPEVDETILHGLREAARSPDSHPLGVVVTGPAGAGKTHLLGWLREKVQGQGGYFFLIELQDERTFWQSVAVSMVDGLVRPAADGARQLDGFLQRLLELTWAQPSLKDAVLGRAPLSPDDLEQFIGALRRTNPVVGMECKYTLRALVLLAGSEPVAIDLGQYYLAGLDAADPTDRDRWRFPRIPKNAQQIVRELLRLLALTGPSAIAVDQLDSLLTRVERAAGGVTESDAQLQHVATGLIDLREIGRRALTVLACLSTSWELIQREALRSASDRFRQEVKLHTIPNAAVARELVEKRFAPSFQEIGFVPPYPTWPVAAEAFGDASDFTPRLLLMRVDRHIANCSRSGRVTELRLLTEETPSAQPRQAPPVDLRALDARSPTRSPAGTARPPTPYPRRGNRRRSALGLPRHRGHAREQRAAEAAGGDDGSRHRAGTQVDRAAEPSMVAGWPHPGDARRVPRRTRQGHADRHRRPGDVRGVAGPARRA